MNKALEQLLTKFSSDFFYWWYNSKGTNTKQGAEQYVRDHPEIVAAMKEVAGRQSREQEKECLLERALSALDKEYDVVLINDIQDYFLKTKP